MLDYLSVIDDAPHKLTPVTSGELEELVGFFGNLPVTVLGKVNACESPRGVRLEAFINVFTDDHEIAVKALTITRRLLLRAAWDRFKKEDNPCSLTFDGPGAGGEIEERGARILLSRFKDHAVVLQILAHTPSDGRRRRTVCDY